VEIFLTEILENLSKGSVGGMAEKLQVEVIPEHRRNRSVPWIEDRVGLHFGCVGHQQLGS